MNISQYLQEHHAVPVTVGKSGAEVFYLDNGTTAKYAKKDTVSEDIWNHCVREARFYESIAARKLPYLPQILHLHITVDETLILMRRHTPLTADQLTGQKLDKIFAALASFHKETPPDFLIPDAAPAPPYLDAQTAAACMEGWLSVLREHHPAFSDDTALPGLAAEQFNRVNQIHALQNPVLCHGDFHLGNILWDDHDNPIFCDFQSCGIGDGCGDLSFFLSRLSADGALIDHEDIVQIYSRYSGLSVREIHNRMALSNFNTSFLFWHQYLHGSDITRVRKIFDAMKSDFAYLCAE